MSDRDALAREMRATDRYGVTREEMADRCADIALRHIEAARAEVAALTTALQQIQELATDTPTSEDAEEALDDIAELCESTLSQSSAGEVASDE